ncbi:MAG: DUF3185 family protein [Campylobacteraceae bacterium]
MFYLGIIIAVAGIAALIFGNNMNNNIEQQVTSIFQQGVVNPGEPFVYGGIAAIVLGVILILFAFYKKR